MPMWEGWEWHNSNQGGAQVFISPWPQGHLKLENDPIWHLTVLEKGQGTNCESFAVTRCQHQQGCTHGSANRMGGTIQCGCESRRLCGAWLRFEQQRYGSLTAGCYKNGFEMTNCDDDVDAFFLAASQQFGRQFEGQVAMPSMTSVSQTPKGGEIPSCDDIDALLASVVSIALCHMAFQQLCSPTFIGRCRSSEEVWLPKKMQANISWASNAWRKWEVYRLKNKLTTEERSYNLDSDIPR